MKIVSGGQTGVDRAALDAAIECNIEAGGWCPDGRKAEDGRIAEHYPLIELPRAGYKKRTLKNVQDSDGTVIIYFSMLSGGTKLTVDFCIKEKKPYVLIDANQLSELQAVQEIIAFIAEFKIQTLNVAGPRASNAVRAYSYPKAVITEIIEKTLDK
ncbi:MAG: putative molybdenum carrier protein [Methyloprofundus sp.]|nr:putative molybdenum carrier protein [Methyloprofundus sp.]